MTHPDTPRPPMSETVKPLTPDEEAQVEAVKWNACCAALRAAIIKYIKSKYTTATAGEAERELLEVSSIFYKDAGQNLLDRIASLERDLAQSREWRPIESAPRDGGEILCFARHYGKDVRFVAIWNGVEWYTGWGTSIQPTHWKPLDAPPTTGSAP